MRRSIGICYQCKTSKAKTYFWLSRLSADKQEITDLFSRRGLYDDGEESSGWFHLMCSFRSFVEENRTLHYVLKYCTSSL